MSHRSPNGKKRGSDFFKNEILKVSKFELSRRTKIMIVPFVEKRKNSVEIVEHPGTISIFLGFSRRNMESVKL